MGRGEPAGGGWGAGGLTDGCLLGRACAWAGGRLAGARGRPAGRPGGRASPGGNAPACPARLPCHGRVAGERGWWQRRPWRPLRRRVVGVAAAATATPRVNP